MLLHSKRKVTRTSRFLSNPARVIVLSFALLITLGTLFLMLPMCAKSGVGTSFLDALFTATSATCVTGLVVVDTFTHFTIGGQLVILFLIQLGGLGLVTFATFFNIAIRRKIGLKTLNVAKESVNTSSINNIGELMRTVFTMTFFVELVGAVVLATVFIPKYGFSGVFISIFIAISSFCNAGFDIFGFEGQFSSLTTFSSEPVVLITVMLLIICGGLGFIVWQDLHDSIKTKKLCLHSKLVLIATLVFIAFGGILFMVFEWNNTQTIGSMNVSDKVLNSFFLSVSSRTAGYNTFPIENMYGISKLFCVILMFIGAAPGSTGGGIKITTFIVLVMTVVSVLSGKDETMLKNRKVDKSVVYKALTIIATAFLAIIVSTSTIFFTSHSGVSFKEIDALFESVSAFGTVGLSSGVTGIANSTSRIVLILTMFLGRVGPLSLGLSLAMRGGVSKTTVVPEAKIIVG